MPSTRVIAVDPERPDPAVIADAAKILREGGLVAFATETVYGLGADATNPSAVEGIFRAKGRPSSNPLIVHVQDKTAALDCVAGWPDRAEILAERFWPGPLTLVLPRSKIIPDIVTAGQDTVGIRVPSPGVARWLILETGRPIAAPSANRSTGISPTLAGHVLKDLDGKIDLILDSGPTTVGLESTVLDLSGDRATILRPGEITAEQLAEALGEPVESSGDPTGPARSPGQMPVHYAPRTPAYRVEHEDLPLSLILEDPEALSCMALIIGDTPEHILPLPPTLVGRVKFERLWEPEESSRLLYAKLHEFDEGGFDFLLIFSPPEDEPRWDAIRDRIRRATRPLPKDQRFRKGQTF